MFLYSSRAFSIYFFHTEEPCIEVMATIFFFPLGKIIRKKKFLVWEMILLHFFAKIKEMKVGSDASSISYNLLPRVIITVRGIESYTT